MYSIDNHEVLVVVEYGDETSPSCVGLEVAPPLNEMERQLVKDWLNRHEKSVFALLLDQLSHSDDASRYGEQTPSAHTSTLERKIYSLAEGIRQAMESMGGREVSVEVEVRQQRKDDILGS